MRLLVSLSAKTIALYHGSPNVFDVFSLDNSAEGAVFLTPSKVRAKRSGKVLYTVMVTYNAVMEVDGKKLPEEHQLEDIERLTNRAAAGHYDLIHIKNFNDYGSVGDTYIVTDVAKLRIVHRSK